VSAERITIDLSGNERRRYERLRARVAKPRPGEPTGFRDLCLLLPDFVVLLGRLAIEPQVPAGAKLVAASTVAYVISPIDLLPEVLLGPFGLIDDVIVVGAGVSFLLNRVHPDLIRAHWPGQEDALESMQAVSEWMESQVTGRLFALLRRLPGLRP
jgi:uncharacterized membrane protein YkvA (DUF1232 family)